MGVLKQFRKLIHIFALLIMKKINKPTVLYGRKISSCVELARETVFWIHPVSFPQQSAWPCKYIFFRPGWTNFAGAESEPSTMQFISRELRPFWKAACAVSLWCNKNFNVGYYIRVWINFSRKLWTPSSCFKHFCVFRSPDFIRIIC